MFKYTLDNKRYHTLNYFFKNKFGCKIAKIPLYDNFSSRNKISGGCIYCSDGSKANIVDNTNTLINQFNDGTKVLLNKWPNSKFIAYFQAGTNTFGSLDKIKELIEPFLNIKHVVGIAIATRPDSISKECLEYLSDLNKRTFLMVEIGLQSSNDNTLKYINRGHDSKCFLDCVKKLKSRNIFTVAHVINGLPYETKKDMIKTIQFVNDSGVDAVKIHMLHVVNNTKLADIYEKEKFHILTKEEYIDIVCDQLELLKPEIVIERITGDPIKEDLIEPKWLIKKFVVLNDIDKEMVKRNIYQGDKIKELIN